MRFRFLLQASTAQSDGKDDESVAASDVASPCAGAGAGGAGSQLAAVAPTPVPSGADVAARIRKLVSRGRASEFAWVSLVVKGDIKRGPMVLRQKSSAGLLGSSSANATAGKYSDGSVVCVAPRLGLLPSDADVARSRKNGDNAVDVVTDTDEIRDIIEEFTFSAPVGCVDVFVDVSFNGGQQFGGDSRNSKVIAYPVPAIHHLSPAHALAIDHSLSTSAGVASLEMSIRGSGLVVGATVAARFDLVRAEHPTQRPSPASVASDVLRETYSVIAVVHREKLLVVNVPTDVLARGASTWNVRLSMDEEHYSATPADFHVLTPPLITGPSLKAIPRCTTSDPEPTKDVRLKLQAQGLPAGISHRFMCRWSRVKPGFQRLMQAAPSRSARWLLGGKTDSDMWVRATVVDTPQESNVDEPQPTKPQVASDESPKPTPAARAAPTFSISIQVPPAELADDFSRVAPPTVVAPAAPKEMPHERTVLGARTLEVEVPSTLPAGHYALDFSFNRQQSTPVYAPGSIEVFNARKWRITKVLPSKARTGTSTRLVVSLQGVVDTGCIRATVGGKPAPCELNDDCTVMTVTMPVFEDAAVVPVQLWTGYGHSTSITAACMVKLYKPPRRALLNATTLSGSGRGDRVLASGDGLKTGEAMERGQPTPRDRRRSPRSPRSTFISSGRGGGTQSGAVDTTNRSARAAKRVAQLPGQKKRASKARSRRGQSPPSVTASKVDPGEMDDDDMSTGSPAPDGQASQPRGEGTTLSSGQGSVTTQVQDQAPPEAPHQTCSVQGIDPQVVPLFGGTEITVRGLNLAGEGSGPSATDTPLVSFQWWRLRKQGKAKARIGTRKRSNSPAPARRGSANVGGAEAAANDDTCDDAHGTDWDLVPTYAQTDRVLLDELMVQQVHSVQVGGAYTSDGIRCIAPAWPSNIVATKTADYAVLVEVSRSNGSEYTTDNTMLHYAEWPVITSMKPSVISPQGCTVKLSGAHFRSALQQSGSELITQLPSPHPMLLPVRVVPPLLMCARNGLRNNERWFLTLCTGAAVGWW